MKLKPLTTEFKSFIKTTPLRMIPLVRKVVSDEVALFDDWFAVKSINSTAHLGNISSQTNRIAICC